jgi:hypothetical protein
MSDDTDRAARKARADAIRAKVKQLQAGETEPADEQGETKPVSPREFIQKEMAKRKKRAKGSDADADAK